MVIASCIIHAVSHYAWPFIGSYWRYGWPRTRRRRRAPCKLSVSLLQLFCYLVPRRLSLSMKICAQRKAGKSKGARRASPPFFTLPMVPCVSSSVTRVLRSPLCQTMRKTERLRRTLAVLDNTRCPLSKRFKILGFSAASIKPLQQDPLCLQIKAAISSRSCKSKCERQRGDSFSPSHICISSGFGSSIGTI